MSPTRALVLVRPIKVTLADLVEIHLLMVVVVVVPVRLAEPTTTDLTLVVAVTVFSHTLRVPGCIGLAVGRRLTGVRHPTIPVVLGAAVSARTLLALHLQ
jgi:hypothetical protein